jgi:hypothetical protein
LQTAEDDYGEDPETDDAKDQERRLDDPIGCRLAVEGRPCDHLEHDQQAYENDARATASSLQQSADPK